VAEKGSSAANWVDNQSTNAANFVEEKGNSAATVINEQSSNAAHWIDEKGHTTSQWVKERGNQAVDLVDTAGTYAIDFIKNPQQEGQKLLNKAGEGIQAGWEWSKEQASKAANWSLEQVNWVSGKVNENIIQLIANSKCPDFVRKNATAQVDDEFRRYAAVIKDNGNPVKGLEVILNDPAGKPFFESILKKYGIPGRVVIK
jgi:hypothetical protein